MASTKLGPAINLEEEADGVGAAVEGPVFIPDSEATSLLVCYSPYDDRDIDCNPYFPFAGPISDSGSSSYTDSEPDPSNCPIFFFDRESSEVDATEYLESDGLTADDFNIWGFYDPKVDEEEEEEIVLVPRCVLGSDQQHGDSGEQGLRVTSIDGLTADDFNIWGFYDPKVDEEEEEEIVLVPRCVLGSDQQHGDSGEQGLRVTSIDSDSDYEDGVLDFTSGDSGNGENDSGQIEVGTGLPPVWDNVLGEETMLADEEWEEVQNAMNWTVSRSEEGEEELSSPSRVSSRDEEEALELDWQQWQLVLTINNAVNYIQHAIMTNPGDIDPSHYMNLASLDEYYDDDVDDILGQIFDNEIGIRGNPPASKRVIEDLPVVELTVEELNKGNMVCAVCKDEMIIDEKVNRLPCRHCYHGECILPWLGIRNTCPVCRFELPTDDLEYERHRRSQRSDTSLFLAG